MMTPWQNIFSKWSVLMFDDLFSFKYITNLFHKLILTFVWEEKMLKDNEKTDDENYDEVDAEFKRLPTLDSKFAI